MIGPDLTIESTISFKRRRCLVPLACIVASVICIVFPAARTDLIDVRAVERTTHTVGIPYLKTAVND
jgi:hypothetical protein